MRYTGANPFSPVPSDYAGMIRQARAIKMAARALKKPPAVTPEAKFDGTGGDSPVGPDTKRPGRAILGLFKQNPISPER